MRSVTPLEELLENFANRTETKVQRYLILSLHRLLEDHRLGERTLHRGLAQVVDHIAPGLCHTYGTAGAGHLIDDCVEYLNGESFSDAIGPHPVFANGGVVAHEALQGHWAPIQDRGADPLPERDPNAQGAPDHGAGPDNEDWRDAATEAASEAPTSYTVDPHIQNCGGDPDDDEYEIARADYERARSRLHDVERTRNWGAGRMQEERREALGAPPVGKAIPKPKRSMRMSRPAGMPSSTLEAEALLESDASALGASLARERRLQQQAGPAPGASLNTPWGTAALAPSERFPGFANEHDVWGDPPWTPTPKAPAPTAAGAAAMSREAKATVERLLGQVFPKVNPPPPGSNPEVQHPPPGKGVSGGGLFGKGGKGTRQGLPRAAPKGQGKGTPKPMPGAHLNRPKAGPP